MAWSERLVLLRYPGEDNDAHGGKNLRTAQVGEWLPTLVSQPNFGASRSQPGLALVMHSENRLPNGMRAHCVVRCDILNTRVAISIRALSGIVEPPSQSCVGSRPHRSEHALRPRLPQIDSFCRLFPAKRALRAELLRKTYRFYDYHAGGGSVPNSSGPFQHSRSPATPLKPDTRLGSPQSHSSIAPSANLIWYPARLDRLLLRSCDLYPAYLSNHLSGKPHVLHTLHTHCKVVLDTSSPRIQCSPQKPSPPH